MADQPLAYMNAEFLESDEARPLRILAEYLEPLRRLKAQNIQDTVVFFGSARVDSRLDATRALARLRRRTSPRTREHLARLKRSRKAVEWSRYYEDARELANRLAKWSLSLESPRHRFVVCSGGGPGIMHARTRVLGLLLGPIEPQHKHARELMERLRAEYRDKVFHTEIKWTSAVSEASAARKTVLEFAPKSPSADAFRRLAGEILQRLGSPRN